MKKLTELVNETKQATRLDIQEDTINFIPKADIERYLEIASKFISPDALLICQWLMDNNATYVNDFGGQNALATFYEKGMPDNEELKPLYKAIGELKKNGRLMEVPVFQTAEQFNGIITKTATPDEVILDLTTERGRNAVAKQYTPLVYKVAKQAVGKLNQPFDDILGYGFEGLTWAMNHYGSRANKYDDNRDKKHTSKVEDDKIMSKTFGQYAAFCIWNHIFGWGASESRAVRIPQSELKKLAEKDGAWLKNNTQSGEASIGKDKDGKDGKTLFDTIGANAHDAETDLDREDQEMLWKEVKRRLQDKFDEKTFDIFCSYYGIFGFKEMQGKKLAEKYGVVQGAITHQIKKVRDYMKNDPDMLAMMSELNEFVKECRHDLDARENDDIYYVSEGGSSYNKNDYDNEE